MRLCRSTATQTTIKSGCNRRLSYIVSCGSTNWAAPGVCAPIRNGSDRQNSNPRRNLIESAVKVVLLLRRGTEDRTERCVAKDILYYD